MSVRVRVDFNERSRDGSLRAHIGRAEGRVFVGDEVIVYDPTEILCGEALVARVDKDLNLLFLDVDWNSFTDDNMPAAMWVAESPFVVFDVSRSRGVSEDIDAASQVPSESADELSYVFDTKSSQVA